MKLPRFTAVLLSGAFLVIITSCSFLRISPDDSEYHSDKAQKAVEDAQQPNANLRQLYNDILVNEEEQCYKVLPLYAQKRKTIILIAGIGGAAVTAGLGAAGAVGAISAPAAGSQ